MGERRNFSAWRYASGLGAQDWRRDFASANPNVPRWFLDDRTDLTTRLGELQMPVLLLWGDADPISPIRVGQHLAELLPCAELLSSLAAGMTWALLMLKRWHD